MIRIRKGGLAGGAGIEKFKEKSYPRILNLD
jgi:hypothetical protein